MVTRALSNHQRQEFDPPKAAQQAVTYARDHVFERSAVQDERAILQAAMDRSMGQASSSHVRQDFERRTAQGEFRTVQHGPHASAQHFTTAAMIRMEREIVGRMQEGNRQDTFSLASGRTRTEMRQTHPELNQAQRGAIDQILESREKIVGLDGVAGAGKTTTLAVIREGAEREGYKVEGFAPTSRAAQQLSGAGIETSTLQATWPEVSRPIPERSDSMCSTRARSLRPSRCMTLWDGSIRATGFSWSAIPGSMRRSKQGGRLRSCRKPACGQ